MALDRNLTQQINLTANGDALLKPIEALIAKLDSAILKLGTMNTAMLRGGQQAELKYRSQVQQIQRLTGELSTLHNLLYGQRNRGRDALLSVLDVDNLGRRAQSASQLRQNLNNTTRAAEALDVRLAQLNQRFARLAEDGRRLSRTDLNKAFNTQEAASNVRKLEREIARLDRSLAGLGTISPTTAGVRDELRTAQSKLLATIQNPRRVNFSNEISQVEVLTARYRALATAELNAARAADRASFNLRKSILANVNQTEEMMRASLQRGARQYAFTPEQARSADMLALGRSIDVNIVKLRSLQQMMSKALDPSNPRSEATLQRLQRYWDAIAARTSEALALRKAYENLPEQRGRMINQYLFGDGGLQFGMRIAGAMAIATGVGAMINAVTEGLTHIVRFEDELARLQAISGATDQQMVKLASSIQQVARDSRYTTVEITQAATQIAQAGFSAEETGLVLRDALMLATGSGSTPTEAVDTLTSALGAFQLQATESTRIVDILMQGLNRSKLSINQMQAAIQYAGATAKENGVHFEELVAIAASLANAGIRSGSTIGTGLRQLMVDLKTPTEDFKLELESLGLTLADVDVKSLGLAEVVKRLTEAGFSAEAAYESFEVRAASSFLAFRNQIDLYDELALSLTEQGAAAEAYERANKSLSAQFNILKNNVLELAAGLGGPLMGALKVITQALGGVVNMLVELNEATHGWLGAIALIGGAAAINPILGVATAIAVVVGAIYDWSDASEELRTRTAEAEAGLTSQQQTISSVDEAISDLINRQSTLKGNQAALQTETINLTARFKELANELQGTAVTYDNLLNAMLRYRGEAMRQAALSAETLKISAEAERLGLRDQLTENISQFRGMSLDGFRHPLLREAIALGRRNEGVGLTQRNDIQAMLNRLTAMQLENERSGRFTPGLDPIVATLQRRLDLMTQISSLNRQIEQADNAISVYNERTSPAGRARDAALVEITSGISEGLRLNKGGSGAGQSLIDAAMANATQRIAQVERELGTLDPKSPRAQVLNDYLTSLEAQIARVRREQDVAARDAEKDAKSLKDRPGSRLTADVVANEIRRRVSGARITDTTRSATAQAGYDRKAGIRRDPNTAPHVSGNALDMAPIPGMDPMEIVAILEDLGLEVVEAPVRAAGIRYVTPNHGTGPHWHFSWKPKTTQYERARNQEAEKAARELQQLIEYQAGAEVKTQESRLDTLALQARNGSITLGGANAEFQAASEALRQAKLNQFDVSYPTKGLGEAALKQRELARAALEAQISQELAEYHAKIWRGVSEFAAKELDAAIAASDVAFERAQFEIEEEFAAVSSRGRTLNNNLNANRFGAGAANLARQEEYNARLSADRQLLGRMDWRILELGMARDQYQAQTQNLPDGTAEQAEAKQKLAETEKKLFDIQQQRNELQRSINERTREFTNIPLKERLEGALTAWADSSGIMNTFAKTLEDSVGPILDQFTTQMTTFFSSIVEGTRTVKQALGDFVRAFAQFVAQIILKALALMAVKAILSAFGLTLEATDGGTVIRKKKFDGGLAANDNEPRKAYGGAYVHQKVGGGRINTGTPLRDSSLYEVAEGEYIVRNKSVRELGLPFMDAINEHGAKGLAKMMGAGSAFTNIQAPRQETNVYVVTDPKEAGMGPNDVLVTVARDILEGGPTKQLIKRVVQGG